MTVCDLMPLTSEEWAVRAHSRSLYPSGYSIPRDRDLGGRAVKVAGVGPSAESP